MRVHSYVQLFALCVALLLPPVLAYKEITGILDQAHDLSAEQQNALRPLFEDMQRLHDHILSTSSDAKASDETYSGLVAEFEQHFSGLLDRSGAAMQYDSSLPTIDQLIGADMSNELLTASERGEWQDIEQLLQDALHEAQEHMDDIVQQATTLEHNLIRINKPKILKYIYKALRTLFGVAARASRAAYCTYSHIPQLNATLHSLYDGVDCYNYSSHLILRVQQRTVETVTTIRANVRQLARVYKQVAAKKSLLGKIVTTLLNITQVLRDVRESLAVGSQALAELRDQLPAAAGQSRDCGTHFAVMVPYMIATVSNVTTCVLHVDDAAPDYDFLRPENETTAPEETNYY